MAEYYLYGEILPGTGSFGIRRVLTYGKKPYQPMDPWMRITKKRMNNPHLWAQLEAVSKGTYVNHLGRGHTRHVRGNYYFP